MCSLFSGWEHGDGRGRPDNIRLSRMEVEPIGVLGEGRLHSTVVMLSDPRGWGASRTAKRTGMKRAK